MQVRAENGKDKSRGSFKRTLRRYIIGALCWLLACLMLPPFMPQIGYGAGAYAEPNLFYLTDLQGRVFYASDARIPVYYTAENPIDISEFEGFRFNIVKTVNYDADGKIISYGNSGDLFNWGAYFYIGSQKLSASYLPVNYPSHGDIFLSSDGCPYPQGSNIDPAMWQADMYAYCYREAYWTPDAIAQLSTADSVDVYYWDWEEDPNSQSWFTADDFWKNYSLTGGASTDDASTDDGKEDPPPVSDSGTDDSHVPAAPETPQEYDQDDILPPVNPSEATDGSADDEVLASVGATDGDGTGTDDSESDTGNPFTTGEETGSKKEVDPLANAYRDYLQNGSSASDHVSDGEESAGDGEDWETTLSAELLTLQEYFVDQLAETEQHGDTVTTAASMTSLPNTGTVYKVASGTEYQSLFDGLGEDEGAAAASAQSLTIVGIPLWLLVWVSILCAPLAIGGIAPAVAYSRRLRINTRLTAN